MNGWHNEYKKMHLLIIFLLYILNKAHYKKSQNTLSNSTAGIPLPQGLLRFIRQLLTCLTKGIADRYINAVKPATLTVCTFDDQDQRGCGEEPQMVRTEESRESIQGLYNVANALPLAIK